MFRVFDKPILIDPDLPAPQIFILTTGLVVEQHEIWLPAHNGADEWHRRGTNIPKNPDDPGTPDIYTIPDHTRQGGNLLEIFVDLFNVTDDEKSYKLIVEIHQADYEPDSLIDEQGTIPGQETKSFAVFAPLELMS